VVEDAAQGLLSTYAGRPVASLGHLAALSFHETKNVIAGEGGALVINDPQYVDRAEILWEKGTDRSRFFRGLVDKYTWRDVGSSFLPGELIAAFLWAQLQHADAITAERLEIWTQYDQACRALELASLQRPTVPDDRRHNAHLYYLLLPPGVPQADVLAGLNQRGVNAVFHYVPLHSSPAGQRFGRVAGAMTHTDDCSARLIRLPLWVGLRRQEVEQVVVAVGDVVSRWIQDMHGQPSAENV
jgi:dTDP-4-amino-4,6-dideoxygalactose transaminase